MGRFRAAVAWFQPTDLQRRSEEQQERGRLIAGTCLAIAAVTTPLLPISLFQYGAWNATTGGGALVILAMLGIALLLRQTGRTTLVGSLVPAVLLVVLTGVALRRGGLGAVNLICFPFLPLVAGFLVGRRAAWAAAVAVGLTMLAFYAVHVLGPPLPAGYTADQRPVIAAVGTSLMGLLVAVIAVLYEVAQGRARRLAAEHVAELRHSSTEVVAARERAEAASRAKGEFLARASHELRTPLNGVLGMTELLLSSELTEEQVDFARDARRSARALLALVDDLLDLSKLEAGRIELAQRAFDPRGPVEDAVGVLAGSAQRKGLELLCRVEPDVPRALRGDADRLRQVLLNLLGNGLKYTDAGTVSLHVSLTADPARVRFEVVDTGIGLPPTGRERLFEPFSQAGLADKGGVGLGLAICQELVRRMGGQIGTDDAAQGSLFWFTLPAPPDDLEERPGPRLPDSVRGLRALVVDDHPGAARAAAELLGHHGFAASTARGGEEAITALQAAADAGEPYELVVVDGAMPDVDGWQVLRRMAGSASLRRTPSVLLLPLGRSLELAELRGMRVGRARKPVVESGLLPAVAAALEVALDAPPVESELPSQSGIGAIDGGGARVLVVDDNEVGRKLATGLLRRFGFSVSQAEDGAQAVAAATREPFDVILMDCRMPVLDGYDATRAIRADEAASGHRAAIVAVTAHALPSERDRCLAAGMDDYLTKPFQAADLARVVLSWARPG